NGSTQTYERGGWRSFLPVRIIIYTSGSLSEWHPIFDEASANRERHDHGVAEALRELQQQPEDLEEVSEDEDAEALRVAVQEETIPSRTILLSHDHLRLALLATLALEE